MILMLYHDLSKVKYWYGPVPGDGPVETDNVSVLYTSEDCYMDDETYPAYYDNVFGPINDVCGSDLDNFDYDYLNAEQCKKTRPLARQADRKPQGQTIPPPLQGTQGLRQESHRIQHRHRHRVLLKIDRFPASNGRKDPPHAVARRHDLARQTALPNTTTKMGETSHLFHCL